MGHFHVESLCNKIVCLQSVLAISKIWVVNVDVKFLFPKTTSNFSDTETERWLNGTLISLGGCTPSEKTPEVARAPKPPKVYAYGVTCHIISAGAILPNLEVQNLQVGDGDNKSFFSMIPIVYTFIKQSDSWDQRVFSDTSYITWNMYCRMLCVE